MRVFTIEYCIAFGLVADLISCRFQVFLTAGRLGRVHDVFIRFILWLTIFECPLSLFLSYVFALWLHLCLYFTTVEISAISHLHASQVCAENVIFSSQINSRRNNGDSVVILTIITDTAHLECL